MLKLQHFTNLLCEATWKRIEQGFEGGSYEIQTGGSTETIRQYYAIAGTTVAMRSGTTWTYFLTDHLGSVVATTDASGTVLSQTRYTEFGEIRTDVGTVTQTDFGYTFQRNLPDTGLMDYKARMYDPLLGRFIQPDTLVPGAGNPQMFNRYAYVKNNPINFSDPSGNVLWDGCTEGDSSSCVTLDNGGSGGSSSGGNGGGGGGGIPPVTPTEEDQGQGSNSKISILDQYVQGWRYVGTAWEIFNAEDAGWGNWVISGGYILLWTGGHVALAVGLAGLVCVAVGPGCVTAVEGALGIGGDAIISTEQYIPRAGDTVYRVWGSEPTLPQVNGASPWGRSWTPIDPSTVYNYRNVSGIPSLGASGAFNSARFVSQGIITDVSGITVQSATSLDGLSGGLVEYVIPNALNNIQLINVSGINPPY